MEQQKTGKRAKISNTPARDRVMFNRYQELIKEEGERAPFLGKGYFYEKLAPEFHIEPATVGICVRRMLKEGDSEHSANN